MLARGCLESAFFLGAVMADASFVDRLVSSDTAHKKRLATSLTSLGAAVTGLSAAQLEELQGFLDSAAVPVAPVTIKQAADTARLSDIYETVYRDLSGRAHPSLIALKRHVELDDHGNVVGLRFGPDTKDVNETILAMTTALLNGMAAMSSAFPQDQWRSEIDACCELHKRLLAGAESA